MKKIAITFLITILLGVAAYGLEYSIELIDSFSDGWNGGSVDVIVNGSVVLDDKTLETGESTIYTFNVSSGDMVIIEYTAGTWATETAYYVYDQNDDDVVSSGETGTPSDTQFTVAVASPHGSGTEADPYLISNLDELEWITQDSGRWSAHYKQDSNIDASATSTWNSDAGFLPIGNTTTKFTGSYDGQIYEIDNLYIDRGSENYVGLFGYTSGATIENVWLDSADVSGDNSVGGLVGYNWESTVSKSYATGSVSGDYNVGGLVGFNDGGSVSNSYSTASVSGSSAVGGLVGYNIANSSVENSYATGSVDGSGDYIGGLVGYNWESTVSKSFATGSVSGASNVGGLVGYNDGGGVENSYWDTETSGQATSSGGTGKTTAEMKDISTFQSVWTITEVGASQNGYPYLAWEEDETGDWLQEQVTVQPPTANDDTATTDEDTSVTIDVLANDTDSDGTLAPSTVTVISGPSHGTATVDSSNGKVIYSPASNYQGDDSFTYTVDDDDGATSNEATVSITVEEGPDGSGTELNPYLISNLDELEWITQDSSRWSAHYKQDSNIDAFATSTWDSGAGFLPIGNTTTNFTGTYDGNEYTISNLHIDRPLTNYVGLFGYTGSIAEIKNVGLVDATVIGDTYIGNIVGRNFGIVNSSYATGSASGSYAYIGGLVGWNVGIVNNSYATGSASGFSDIGGLVGGNGGTVENSYASGSASGSNAYIGGLVGGNYGTGTVSNSYATGSASGSVEVGSLVGGLVGGNDGTVENSYSTGSVDGDSDVGGLVGDNSGTVTNSYWDIDTSGQTTSDGGTGKSTDEMKDISTFQSAWTIDRLEASQNDYPYLAWQEGETGVWRQEQVTVQPQPQPPTASFTYTPSDPRVEKEVVFDAADSNDVDGNIVSYKWDLGDGTTVPGEEVTHTYNDKGMYTVTLTVTDNDGLTGTESADLEVTYEVKYVRVRDSGWSMVSMPLEPENKDPAFIFEGVIPQHIFYWDQGSNDGQGQYLTPTSGFTIMNANQGSWIYLEEENAPRTFTVPGVYSGKVTITLGHPGWHQVGSPLDYGWSNIGVTKEGEDTMTVAAQASGPSSPHWMSKFIWDYNADMETYTAYQAGNSSFNLEPGKAYWVRTRVENVKLVIPHAAPPPVPSSTQSNQQANGIPMTSTKADRLNIPRPPAPPVTLSVGEFRVNAMPNPLRSNDQVTFIAAGSDVQSFQVNIYDASGRQIHTSPRQTDHTYTWEPQINLTNGLYIYQVTARKTTGGMMSEVGKLLVLK